MYNIQVHVPYEKQQYIKKRNHDNTTYPCLDVFDGWIFTLRVLEILCTSGQLFGNKIVSRTVVVIVL